MCSIIKYNVQLNEIISVQPTSILGSPLRPILLANGTQHPISRIAPSKPKYNTTLDYSVTPFDHLVFPYLTIRRPSMPSNTPQYNEIPVQLPSALHSPFLKRRIALNVTIVFYNLFWTLATFSSGSQVISWQTRSSPTCHPNHYGHSPHML